MGTKCNIYIEDEHDAFIGVKCSYDGYPEHMLRELEYCDYNMLKDYIIVAGSRGGLRLFYPSRGQTEFIGAPAHYIYNPHLKDSDADYFYVVTRSNKITWKKRTDTIWTTEWHRKQQ